MLNKVKQILIYSIIFSGSFYRIYTINAFEDKGAKRVVLCVRETIVSVLFIRLCIKMLGFDSYSFNFFKWYPKK